ncbi:eukaryotic translation initiation factor 5B-like [Saccostrea cucullata]|uniref:eukaryotic translation initiation factor 5B-like n=1 Tax=Saccostrea cuccullata TaxID=36930 RepID=UPI002ED2D92F
MGPNTYPVEDKLMTLVLEVFKAYLLSSDDREDAESMMDRYIETGSLTEKRKMSVGFHDLSDSSDDELLKEKQKRMRVSYAAGQKKMKEKYLEIKENKQQEMEDNTQKEKEQEKESPSEMTDTQEARSSDEDEQVERTGEQKKSGATEDEKTKDDANKENEQTIFKIKKVIHSETPVRMKKVVPSEDTSSSRLLKKSRIDRKSSWLRNLEEVVSSDDEEDLRLSKEELMTKCQMQAFELQKRSKEIRRLSQENENLRAALGLAKELPDLLQKVRRLKSSPTPSPSTKPSAVLSTPKPVSPTPGIRRAPLQAITPVARENENGEEVVQFGSACISAKKLKSNVGSRYSHLVNYIMEEIFTEEEMAESSLTGSKGRTKTEDI